MQEFVNDVINHDVDLSHALTVVLKDLSFTAQLDAAVSSYRWLTRHAREATQFNFRTELIDHALRCLRVGGDILEFGVFTGTITRYIRERDATRPYHAFDSFLGVPKAMNFSVAQDAFSLGGRVPALPEGVIVHDGWFSETLPVYLRSYSAPVALAYIDCDLYESVLSVLDNIMDRLVAGSILIFDDWYNFPNWQRHSFRALREAGGRSKWSFVPIAFCTKEHAVSFVCQTKQAGG